VLDRAPEHVREGRNEAHAFVAATTGGELAGHAIMTPGVVTEEMVNAAVQMTGKGGKVTIAAVGRLTERAVG
jgi:S-(hydroxymethyl)glutathione dehydrogenase/alcohol dehydrogenase